MLFHYLWWASYKPYPPPLPPQKKKKLENFLFYQFIQYDYNFIIEVLEIIGSRSPFDQVIEKLCNEEEEEYAANTITLLKLLLLEVDLIIQQQQHYKHEILLTSDDEKKQGGNGQVSDVEEVP